MDKLNASRSTFYFDGRVAAQKGKKRGMRLERIKPRSKFETSSRFLPGGRKHAQDLEGFLSLYDDTATEERSFLWFTPWPFNFHATYDLSDSGTWPGAILCTAILPEPDTFRI